MADHFSHIANVRPMTLRMTVPLAVEAMEKFFHRIQFTKSLPHQNLRVIHIHGNPLDS